MSPISFFLCVCFQNTKLYTHIMTDEKKNEAAGSELYHL